MRLSSKADANKLINPNPSLLYNKYFDAIFFSDDSAFKTLYLAIGYDKKRTIPIRAWNETIVHFIVKFDERINCL